MGYESKVYIVSETYSTFIDGKKPYAEKIVEFDLCIGLVNLWYLMKRKWDIFVLP